jgi:thymidylate synthase
MNNPQYKPICRANELIVGTGNSIIITGWTPKERVAKLLQPHEYACIGNLYSPMYGLTPLIVNLLANPYNWDIHLLSATNQDKVAGAIEALYYFLKGRFFCDDIYYKVTKGKDGDIIGSLSNVFDPRALRKAVDSLRLWEPEETHIEDLVECVKSAERWKYPLRKFAEPIFIEIPKPESPTLPGDLSGHLVKGQTVAEVWLKAIALIRSTGRLTESQYGERQELIQMTSVVYNEPADFHYEPWLPVTPDFMEGYIPQMCSKDLPEGISYTYGSKIRNWQYKNSISVVSIDQLTAVASKLVANPDSSQCTISLWDVETDTFSKSPPCLTNIWVRLVDNRLIMIATFRSHDVYTAYPSNVMALRELQGILLDKLYKLSDKVYNAGELIINSQSAHIYGHSFQHTDDVLKTQKSTKINYNDPVGNFVITCRMKFAEVEITVTQTDPTGLAVAEYAGNSPLKLIREIAIANPGIQAVHLGYLGMELQKAAIQGWMYKQDK